MEFQDRLYKLRRERGISQEELAGVVGVSRQAVQKWESGASRPDMENLVAIARYFDVTLDYLIQGMETPVAAPAAPTGRFFDFHYEYQSKRTLWGLPLLHIHLGITKYGFCRAKGIVAIGNIATGLLSIGGASVGAISLGALSVGGLALGAAGLGGLAVGGLAVGLAAAGGLAVGVLAVGGLSLGIYSIGGLACASQVAMGGAAKGYIAIGDAVDGLIAFQKDTWGPGTGVAVRSAILQNFPMTPHWLADLFTAFL